MLHSETLHEILYPFYSACYVIYVFDFLLAGYFGRPQAAEVMQGMHPL